MRAWRCLLCRHHRRVLEQLVLRYGTPRCVNPATMFLLGINVSSRGLVKKKLELFCSLLQPRPKSAVRAGPTSGFRSPKVSSALP